MKALVTGGKGFVGLHLTALLEAEGMTVQNYSTRDGYDVRDYEQLRKTVEHAEADYIFHLAAVAAPPEALSDPRRGLDVNIYGTFNLLEAVRHSGQRPRIHIAGTSEEFGYDTQPTTMTELSPCRPTQPYGVTKLAASHLGLVYARHYGLHVVVTRAYNHTGPGRPARYVDGAFARRIVEVERSRRDKIKVGNLEAVRNFTDVRDVVRAYRLAVDQPSGSDFLVCSGRTVTIQEVLDILVSRAERPVAVEVDPSLWRPIDTETFQAPSHAKLTAATRWEPRIPLEQTLADVLAYWRTRL